MSQIASAYIVSSELRNRLERSAFERQADRFWQALHTSSAKVNPEFPYSGSVLAVVLTFLEEQGISLPIHLQDIRAKAVLESEYGLVLCIEGSNMSALMASLDALTPSDQELHLFFEAFGEEELDEAGVAMQEGLAFLRRALRQQNNAGDWLLLFIG